jgi:uncharacterized membrane protein YdcZ (DUF606 family)
MDSVNTLLSFLAVVFVVPGAGLALCCALARSRGVTAIGDIPVASAEGWATGLTAIGTILWIAGTAHAVSAHSEALRWLIFLVGLLVAAGCFLAFRTIRPRQATSKGDEPPVDDAANYDDCNGP